MERWKREQRKRRSEEADVELDSHLLESPNVSTEVKAKILADRRLKWGMRVVREVMES